MKKNFQFISISYILVILALFLYSYTQVDLNLTLSQWSVWQVIQKAFQYIGWFQRPLSTALYVGILLLLTIYYLLFLWLVKKNKLSVSQFWRIVIPLSVILLFSYNAFSYDLFNYLFDARIVTYHHQDPYLYRALDYPLDPWITFMRWTHRTYPYGPVWLGLTVPLSFIGMKFFLPTLFLFKSLMVGSFLGSVYYIGKILDKISPNNKLLGMVFFALNPLVIIESLVSAHHDIVMMFFALASIYFLMNRKYFLVLILLGLSIGIKFATVLLLPIFVALYIFQKSNKKIPWSLLFLHCTLVMVIAVVVASLRTNFQPWYLLYILPFGAFLSRKYYIIIPSTIISLVALLNYVPFLYLGNWNPPVPEVLFWLTASSIIVSVFLISVWYTIKRS